MNAISTIVADNKVIIEAAEKLVQAVTHDDRASGGLLSRDTIRAAEELRLVLLRHSRR